MCLSCGFGLRRACCSSPRWCMTVCHGGMILSGGNRRTRRKNYPSATLSTTNPTWTDLGANPGLRGERPVTSRLSHGTASLLCKNDCHECLIFLTFLSAVSRCIILCHATAWTLFLLSYGGQHQGRRKLYEQSVHLIWNSISREIVMFFVTPSLPPSSRPCAQQWTECHMDRSGIDSSGVDEWQ
jgi:hypothetical protein